MMICTICGREAWARQIYNCRGVQIFIVRCDKCSQIERVRVQGKVQRVTRVLKGRGVQE